MTRSPFFAFLAILLVIPSTVAADPVRGPETPTATNPGDQFRPAVAYDAEHDQYLAVWHEDVSGVLQIVGRIVDADGVPQGLAFPLTEATNDQSQADAVYLPDVDRYLVVWTDDFAGDGSDHDLEARFVPWDGLDPDLTAFTILDTPADERNPRLAAAPSIQEVLVVWDSFDGSNPPLIEAQRWSTVGSSASPVLPIAIEGSFAYSSPRVTWSAENGRYLVVYERTPAGGVGDIYAAHLSFSGTVLASDIGIAGFPGVEGEPDVAACEDRYLVVWAGNDGGGTRVYSRSIAADLTLGPIDDLSDPLDGQGWPAVTCRPSDGGYVVTREVTIAGEVTGVAGAFVDAAGMLRESFEVRSAGGGSPVEYTRPALATGNTRALVIWEQDRDASHQDIWSRWVDLGLFLDGFESGDTSRW